MFVCTNCSSPSTSNLVRQNRFHVIVRPKDTQFGSSKTVMGKAIPRRSEFHLMLERRCRSDRAFYSAPKLRHVEVAQGITQIGSAAWQSCDQLQIVRLPLSVVCLQDGAFQRCYALSQITAPGCVQFGRRVFAECCSLSRIGLARKPSIHWLQGRKSRHSPSRAAWHSRQLTS